MAVCNLFGNLTSASGNFMMFSQYVEDITRNYTNGNNWKVIPTGFVALNVDYKVLKSDNDFINTVLSKGNYDLNAGIPKYFQNCFENACAYARANNPYWSPEISKNLFWNYMFDGKFLSVTTYSEEYDNVKYVPEIVYYGDINMHAYNEHQGMGYGEIYCYIPTDAKRMHCSVIKSNDRDYDVSNSNTYLEGFVGNATKTIEDYVQAYPYNKDFTLYFDDDTISYIPDGKDTKYNINTIVVTYSVFHKINNSWEVLYTNIPLGMYFAGKFDSDGNITNGITKYVSTLYDTGTSYGLRICNRFSVTTNGNIINTDIITDDFGYSNMCQMMTSMNENLSRMLDISKSSVNTTQQYKDLLSMIKNNRTNVPYVKEINGVDYWFINGRYIAPVGSPAKSCCSEYSINTIEKRLDNLKDNDPTNDWTCIKDEDGCDCDKVCVKDLAETLGLNPDNYDEYDSCCCCDYEHFDNAEDTEIIDVFKHKRDAECDCECLNCCDVDYAKDSEVVETFKHKASGECDCECLNCCDVDYAKDSEVVETFKHEASGECDCECLNCCDMDAATDAEVSEVFNENV